MTIVAVAARAQCPRLPVTGPRLRVDGCASTPSTLHGSSAWRPTSAPCGKSGCNDRNPGAPSVREVKQGSRPEPPPRPRGILPGVRGGPWSWRLRHATPIASHFCCPMLARRRHLSSCGLRGQPTLTLGCRPRLVIRSLISSATGPRCKATETDLIVSLMRLARACLAFLLASPDEGFYAVLFASRRVLDPFQEMTGMQWGNAEPFAPPITGLSIEVLARLQEWTRTRRFLGRAPVGGDALLARLYPGGHLSTSASGSSAPRRGWAGRGRRARRARTSSSSRARSRSRSGKKTCRLSGRPTIALRSCRC